MVLKEEIFNSSALGICGGLKITDFVTVFNLGGCVGLERRDFNSFYFGQDVVVLEEVIFNSFYIWRMWWS